MEPELRKHAKMKIGVQLRRGCVCKVEACWGLCQQNITLRASLASREMLKLL